MKTKQEQRKQKEITSRVVYKTGLSVCPDEGLDYLDRPTDEQGDNVLECEVNRKDSDCRVRG